MNKFPTLLSVYIKMTHWRYLVILMMGLQGCIHDDFSAPEPWTYPDGQQLSVSELRNMFNNEPVIFDTDLYVYATVTMDDKSGNIYRSAYIQDATGGINLRLVAPGGLYRGDSIRVYLKGTTLSSYQRMLQLDNVNVDRHIEKLAVSRHIEPKPVTITQVRTGNFQGQLVRLSDVQFSAGEVDKPFADAEGLQTLNRMLEDCDGNKVIVRTSGYANFADQPVPSGKGSLVAVAAQFQSDIQLYIRDFNELNMAGDRCAIPGDDYALISLASLRQAYNEGATIIPANSRIEGVVISDLEHDNHPGQNLYLSDESGYGIAIRFTAFHNFPLGTRLRIVFASPMPMTRFRGLLQIENIPAGNAYDLGPANLPEPVTLTIQQAISQMERYQSTLIRIQQVSISGGSTFNGNLTLNDGTGQMLMYTYNWASFASNSVPAGVVTLTGILSVYDEPQMLLRSLQDINQNK